MTHDTLESLRSHRRDVIKGIGASAGLAALGGTAAAQQGDGEADGTPTPGADEEPGGDAETGETGTVHTVRTMIGPATNPQRPADFFYEPTGLHVEPGDVVKFVAATPDHNVVSYHPSFGMRRRVPEGVRAFSSPILGWRSASIDGDQVEPPEEPAGHGPGGPPEGPVENGQGGDGPAEPDGAAGGNGDRPVPDTWLQAFDTPGVYDILCSPHEAYGMAMRIVVGDETDAPFETSDPDALEEPRAGPVGLARVTLTDPALQPEEIVDAGVVQWESLESNQDGDVPEEVDTPEVDVPMGGNETDGNETPNG